MFLSLKVFSNASARPTLYSWSCEMTYAFFGDFAVMRKFAMAGPWSLSFATTRCQYFQPFAARPGLVADGDTLGILPCSRTPPTAFDSPENAGPIRAVILSVPIAVCTSEV